MATEMPSLPTNGNYAPHSGYGSLEQGQNGYSTNSHSQTNYQATGPSSTTSAQASGAGTTDIPKDEVGWYFVEQYYTTLSRSPEKLYLFYNKRSQFVLGQETDKVAVCVGQKAINDKIKELEFQDCKVRVTNVDSQASDSNIVIQVIGEISNKAQPHKKFTQTFVLAGQTNGYFVLNDIFRYIVEEEDEQEPASEKTQQEAISTGFQEPAPTVTGQQEPETLTSSQDPAAVEHDAMQVDKELEDKVLGGDADKSEQTPPTATTNGVSNGEAEVVHAEEAPVAAVSAPEEEAAPQDEEPAEQASVPAEKPKDPEPTPAISPAKQNAQPVSPPSAPSQTSSKPAAPKSWASLAAAAHRVATPAAPAPAPQQVPSPAAQQAKTATTAPQPAASAPAQAAPAPSSTPAPREESPAPSTDEWTSVGDHKKQQPKTQAGAGAQEERQNRAYIKNVHENVDGAELKTLLESFGEVIYFDIARQKNCAFVDFKTVEGYNAAVKGNPHTLGNDRIVVEERRTKPGSYPYVQGGHRGGMRGGRGGANQGTGRGSFQGRGNFAPRGRGGASTRGRGAPQAA